MTNDYSADSANHHRRCALRSGNLRPDESTDQNDRKGSGDHLRPDLSPQLCRNHQRPDAMKVLVGCEFSGKVRDAFNELGHEAWSCDFKPTRRPGRHIEGDVTVALRDSWDLFIAFPPCTHLCVSGARYFKDKKEEQEDALLFVAALMTANVGRIAIENPVGVISTRIRKPDQIIQPYMFGDGEQKATCLWLKNLPKLVETEDFSHTHFERIRNIASGPYRGDRRSVTYTGIADAMARQWGCLETLPRSIDKVYIRPEKSIKPKRCPSCKRSWNEQVCNNCGYGF